MLRKQSELYPAPNTYVSGEWNVTYTYNEDQKPALHIDMENQSNIDFISSGAVSDVTDSSYTLTDNSVLEEGMTSLLTNATSLSSVGDRLGVWCSFEFDSPETLSNIGMLAYSYVGLYSDAVEPLVGMRIPITAFFNQMFMQPQEENEGVFTLQYSILTDLESDHIEGIIENWDPTTEAVASVIDFNTNKMEFWVSRDGGTKLGETDLLELQELIRLEFEDPSFDLIGGFDKAAIVMAGRGKEEQVPGTSDTIQDLLPNGIRIKANKTFDIPDVISLFDSSSGYVIDGTVMPDTNPSNRAYVVKTPESFISTHLGVRINDGDIVAFGSKGEPVLAIKKDPDANIFTDPEKTKLAALPSNQTLAIMFDDKVDREYGKGLIEPAPQNNKQYARRNNAWVEVTGDVEEAPFDGKKYTRRNNAWAEYKGDEIKDVQDVTGKKWLRTRNVNSAEWVLYEEPSPGIEEAPSDGKAYVRKDEAWEETSPATGGSRAASNYIVRAVKDQIVEDGKGFYSGAAWSEELSLWVVCSTIGIYTAPYDSNTWTKVHSTGGSNVIWVSELSLFVVLGTYYVITSSDGTTWTQRNFPGTGTAPSFRAIAWSPEQGKMIAVSEATNTEGNIISSTDGITWTRSSDLPTSGGGRGEDIIWAPGLSKWVTCGTGGFRISSDGVTWTKVGTPPGVGKNPVSVTYNPSDGSLSATVSITGSSSKAILQSTNGGTSWVKISEVESNNSAVTIDWIDDLGMYILTSTDNNKKSFDLLKFTTIVGGGSGPNGLGWGASIASIIFPTNNYGTHSIKKTI